MKDFLIGIEEKLAVGFVGENEDIISPVGDDHVVDSDIRDRVHGELTFSLLYKSGIVRVCFCSFTTPAVLSPLFIVSTVSFSGEKINLYCYDVDEYVPCR